MSCTCPRKLELLAPAKNFESGRAALLCGADALYVGAPRFGARAAAGVSVEEIGRLCELAHRFGARVFVTMNTLLYEQELAEAERLATRMWQVGADALIVQDMAFLRMDLPPIDLHASTQMCTTTPEQVRFLADVGFSRVVLERAMTLQEIEQLSRAADVEIEAFIHGALCVSYSGRCYMSRTMSARSGNRGDCSQACRLPYDLLDEQMQPLVRNRHLLSLQDMNATERLEAMIDAGVTSFKVEGRLKDENYVRNVVGWYRRRMDEIIARRPDLCRASEGVSTFEFEPNPAKSFSRGGISYFLDGACRGVASFDTPKAFGEPLGQVRSVRRDSFQIQRAAGKDVQLNAGDGLCFVTAAGEPSGTNVNRIEGDWIWPNRMEGIRPGVELYRNYDHRYVTALSRSRLRRAVPTTASVRVTASEMELTLSDGTSQVTVSRSGDFELAQQPDRALATIRTQLSKSGETIFDLTDVKFSDDEVRFVPVSVLNELRREAFQQLDTERLEHYCRRQRLPEDSNVRFPKAVLEGDENVVNSLAERFYRDHGVTRIEPGYDLRSDLKGVDVMRMRYCIRRELGMCLRDKPAYTGKLYLRHGTFLYELRFDCARCMMTVHYCGSAPEPTMSQQNSEAHRRNGEYSGMAINRPSQQNSRQRGARGVTAERAVDRSIKRGAGTDSHKKVVEQVGRRFDFGVETARTRVTPTRQNTTQNRRQQGHPAFKTKKR